jgi:predicted nucleic acid-binding protein
MGDERTFVDTNVLVYAYDADGGDKHGTARSLLLDLWDRGTGALSIQVLQEFYLTATRKLPKPLGRRTAREVVETYKAWAVHQPGVDDLVVASELEERHRLSFWDALIIVSAQRSGAQRLLSEDLQHGRRIAGLEIRNPFSSS